MRYCTDTDINAIRDSVLSNLSPDSTQAIDFQLAAGRNIEFDLISRWYTGEDVFDARLLPYAFDYDYKQVVPAVPIGTRVDKLGVIYEKINSALSTSTNLASLNYADVDNWKQVECTFPPLFRDLAVFQSLFLIYRYLSGDSDTENTFERQRGYFKSEYQHELARVLEIGIDYDIDASGIIDDDETRLRTSNITISKIAEVEW